jgi:hypothetical protein
MSSVPKLGNNRYLATSKGVNRMLNQLNGILAADNLSIQTVTATSATTNISFANGNFVNLTLFPTVANTITFSDYVVGTYHIRVIQPSTASGIVTWPSVMKKSGGSYTVSASANNYDLIRLVCDGTNLYINGISLNLS